MKNEKYFNLIETILILGASNIEIEKLLNNNIINPNEVTAINTKILEEYKSINLIDEDDFYLDNINMVYK